MQRGDAGLRAVEAALRSGRCAGCLFIKMRLQTASQAREFTSGSREKEVDCTRRRLLGLLESIQTRRDAGFAPLSQ